MEKTVETIRFLMQNKGLKESDLDRYLRSKQSSMIPINLEDIKNGNYSLNKETLYHICEFMDVPITFLFVLSEDPKNIPVYKRWIFRIIKKIVLFLI